MPQQETRKISNLLQSLNQSKKKGLAWLIDPDKFPSADYFIENFDWVKDSDLDLILVGGSDFERSDFSEIIDSIKKISGEIPVVIFPGSQLQLAENADAILFLSLLSGRNPDLLIGQHVHAAPKILKMGLEVLPTAYLLVNNGEITRVHTVSQTLPILNSNPTLVKNTALAGYYLGLKYFFIDAGSGATNPVSSQVIESVKDLVPCPLIVGGGIDNLEKLKDAFEAGADLVVLGNVIEKDPGFLSEVLDYKAWYNLSLNIN
ncbi:putative glycerol-1-phosphate prenyltransferase [Algoriphagus iocasae]|uniref:Geranylgeranylglyceryl phosphate synthase n=1 Tax=Algoriphagus iocasae TaxID=1836499 RepID=A0A841MMK7_9BACT|nr:geranylgeranylglyceryl/heptaprenylglyceryl phosphate synthase [Algoriphagus iocasae]MBB6326747.1 putative glycerol-1-phosphate prenyltransferase [Algoriphagus iocasae]